MTSAVTAPAPGKSALIVIGMHRSGTSAATGALRCLGVRLGRKLYAGHRDVNARGYFEHGEIADADDEALLALGSSWDDVALKEEGWWRSEALAPYGARIRRSLRRDFRGEAPWAVKDPRICRLLPWWLDLLAAENVQPRFLFVIRSPEAVCRSLARRDGFSRDKACLLWALHYLEAERWSRGRTRAFLGYDRFLHDPVGELGRVEAELDLSFPVSPERAMGCLGEFLSADLRHHGEGEGDPGGSLLVALAREAHGVLRQAADEGGAPDTARLDALWGRMEAWQQAQAGVLAEHLRGVGRQRGRLELTVSRLVRSWSWYTGKPVRFVERLLRRDV